MFVTAVLAPLFLLVTFVASIAVPNPYANHNPYSDPALNKHARAEHEHTHLHARNNTFDSLPKRDSSNSTYTELAKRDVSNSTYASVPKRHSSDHTYASLPKRHSSGHTHPTVHSRQEAPSNFTLSLTSFPNNGECKGYSFTKTYTKGKCLDLNVPAMSWSSIDIPGTAELEMSLYPAAGCQGQGSVEHLDADGDCFTPSSMFLNGNTLQSICVGC